MSRDDIESDGERRHRLFIERTKDKIIDCTRLGLMKEQQQLTDFELKKGKIYKEEVIDDGL